MKHLLHKHSLTYTKLFEVIHDFLNILNSSVGILGQNINRD